MRKRRKSPMLKLMTGAKDLTVEFCDRRRSVCDPACSKAIVDWARDKVLLQGPRVT
jgi:hypothetical protein